MSFHLADRRTARILGRASLRLRICVARPPAQRRGAETFSAIAETLTAKRARTRMIFKRVFGKKVTLSAPPDIGPGESAPPRKYGANVELDMKEVASYASAMARHRGYEDETAAMIARRVVFLERRDLPGLAHLHREVFLYHNQPLDSRFSFYSPDGPVGGHCPFYAGVALEPSFQMLTAVPPEDRRWAPAPSNALLLVPKLVKRRSKGTPDRRRRGTPFRI